MNLRQSTCENPQLGPLITPGSLARGRSQFRTGDVAAAVAPQNAALGLRRALRPVNGCSGASPGLAFVGPTNANPQRTADLFVTRASLSIAAVEAFAVLFPQCNDPHGFARIWP